MPSIQAQTRQGSDAGAAAFREHHMVRIRVENGLRRVKVFRIMKVRYRNKLKKYDRINTLVCGVVNQTVLLKRECLL